MKKVLFLFVVMVVALGMVIFQINSYKVVRVNNFDYVTSIYLKK